MHQENVVDKSYNRSKTFRIIIGVISLLYSLFELANIIEYIYYDPHFSDPDTFYGYVILFLAGLSLTIFIWLLYGIKDVSLIAISTAFYTLSQLKYLFGLGINSNGFVLNLTAALLLSAVYMFITIVALRHFKKEKISKILSVFIFIAVIIYTNMSYVMYNTKFSLDIYKIFFILINFAYMSFIVFCSKEYKKIRPLER